MSNIEGKRLVVLGIEPEAQRAITRKAKTNGFELVEFLVEANEDVQQSIDEADLLIAALPSGKKGQERMLNLLIELNIPAVALFFGSLESPEAVRNAEEKGIKVLSPTGTKEWTEVFIPKKNPKAVEAA